MIADNCHLGILFGGQRFMLFLIHEFDDSGVTRRRMLCSRIYQTFAVDGSPNAIRVAIAALLGSKEACIQSQKLVAGFKLGLRPQDKKGYKRRTGPASSNKDKTQQSSERGRGRLASPSVS